MAELVTTNSATPLDPVSVVVDPSGMVTHVWLRENISQKELTTQRDANSEMEVAPMVTYTADELYFVLPGNLSVEQVTESFDDLWDQYAPADDIEDRVTKLEQVVSSVAAAASLDL